MQQSTQQLQQFISSNNLVNENGFIVFNAAVTVTKEKSFTYTVQSEIQVIKLPVELVLYIINFTEPGSLENEMYRTAIHIFTYLPGKQLLIEDTAAGTQLLFSITAEAIL